MKKLTLLSAFTIIIGLASLQHASATPTTPEQLEKQNACSDKCLDEHDNKCMRNGNGCIPTHKQCKASCSVDNPACLQGCKTAFSQCGDACDLAMVKCYVNCKTEFPTDTFRD